ncbi:sigma factor, partial [Streptomyces sp. NPDC001215]
MTAATSTAPGTTAEHELAALQREHGRPLFALLLRLCDGDRQRAEDLSQETFLRAWQHPEALRAHEFDSVRPWLLTVGRRLAIDAAKGAVTPYSARFTDTAAPMVPRDQPNSWCRGS